MGAHVVEAANGISASKVADAHDDAVDDAVGRISVKSSPDVDLRNNDHTAPPVAATRSTLSTRSQSARGRGISFGPILPTWGYVFFPGAKRGGD